MNAQRPFLRIVACAGMTLSWRYAWVTFLTSAVIHFGFPLGLSAASLATAAFCTYVADRRRWPRYQHLLLQFVGFTGFSLLLMHQLWYNDTFLFSPAWTGRLPQTLSTPGKWATMVLALGGLGWVANGGRTLIRQCGNHAAVSLQFDKGLGLFILLLLVKLIAREKGGIVADGPGGGALVGAFFIFGLLAVALARRQSVVRRSFMDGTLAVGGLMSAIAVGVVVAGACLVWLHPLMARTADRATHLLGAAAEPLLPLLTKLLLMIFVPGKIREVFGPMDGPGGSAGVGSPELAGWTVLLLKSFGFVCAAVIGLLALALAGFGLRQLLAYLLARRAGTGREFLSKRSGLNWPMIWYRLGRGVWQRMVVFFRGLPNARYAYCELCRWARRSGLPISAGETPRDYGRKIGRFFPLLTEEITLVVEAFNHEVYGQQQSDRTDLLHLARALRKMRHPRFYPARLRVWFTL